MIYSTLKENREKNPKFVSDIDEFVTQVGLILGDEYIADDGYTDWDKIQEDFTERQVESKVLKWVKEDAKDQEDGAFLKYGRLYIDRVFAYEDIEKLIRKGELKASDVKKIDKMSGKYNFSINGDIRTENGWEYQSVSDLIDRYFPCTADDDEGCTNCGNCR